MECYKGHNNSSKGTKRDLNLQEKNQTLGKFLKGLEEEEEEVGKYNPSMEQDTYKIGQKTTIMKTTNKKVRECSNKHQTKIVKLMYL
jgi:hypothetical protein